MKLGEMSGAELLDIIAGVPTLERNQAKAELLARLNAGGSPDFKTVNSAIEALTDSAQLLREKEGSAGFDASVVLIIERAIQALKSVEPEGASQPLQARPICPRCQDLNIDMEFCNDGFVKAQCRNCHHAASTHGNLHEFFSAPPAMPTLQVTQAEITEMRRGEQPPNLDWDKVHALPEPWKEVWNGDKARYLQQYPEWMVNAAAELFAHDICDAWAWNDYVSAATLIISRHFLPSSPQLEQVAREIAEHNCEHFADDCRADYVNRFTAQNLAILQRHFPGSEGAVEALRGEHRACTGYCIICGVPWPCEYGILPEVSILAEYIWDVRVGKIKLPRFKDEFIAEVYKYLQASRNAASPPVAAEKCGTPLGFSGYIEIYCGRELGHEGAHQAFTTPAPLTPRKETE